MFGDHESCPCGSGKIVADCSCRGREFVPRAVSTKTPGERTGKINRRCYASPLSDCSRQISAEHPVSQSALREVLSDDTVRVFGKRFGAQGLEGKVIGVKSATKRALCQRHNSALSSLDQVGAAFTRAHVELMTHLGGANESHYHSLFNGYDIERWMLKILCAQQHGERIPGSHDLHAWSVPTAFLEILFDGAPFPPSTGLYLPKHPVKELTTLPGIGTSRTYATRRQSVDGLPIFGTTVKHVVGIQVSILGIAWELLMEAPNPVEYVYRPRMLRFPKSAVSVAHFHFGWEQYPPTFAGKSAYRDENGVSDAMLEAVRDIRQRRAK